MQEYSHEYADHWFYTPSPFEKASGIWPIRAGRTSSKPHYKIGPRFITYYSLHFVLDGKGEFSQGAFKKTLRPGDIFCLYPKQTHQYRTDPKHCLQMFWFAFDGRQAQSLLQRIGLNEHSPFIADLISKEVRSTIEDLGNKFSDLKESEILDRISLIYKLFYQLSNRALEKNLVKKITSQNWLKRSIDYMNTHYAEGISVTDVAKYVGLHRSYFTSSFIKKMNMGPLQYLLSLKMNKASHMLKATNYTITEIALSIGYSDLYSFSRAFKSYFGQSPKQFRECQ
ncbi:AraC-like DNA-binding protein [Pullulanibacillus pueri]|uniref:Msm operon regulatory protein n=1 Tax=Pullulanibacillus pueri TaxID=1437324 RepID=A0A8J2ZYZ3_9BACL|nr:AraC family transcriptional regulator [Pullulanibacillus pueri]MBM7683013.1 AraC-like DNA-binding protein [Pullulanibacillus pueri]GGH85871.1 Msm operon regulatory protein [Pullulanibacillus pueri]